MWHLILGERFALLVLISLYLCGFRLGIFSAPLRLSERQVFIFLINGRQDTLDRSDVVEGDIA